MLRTFGKEGGGQQQPPVTPPPSGDGGSRGPGGSGRTETPPQSAADDPLGHVVLSPVHDDEMSDAEESPAEQCTRKKGERETGPCIPQIKVQSELSRGPRPSAAAARGETRVFQEFVSTKIVSIKKMSGKDQKLDDHQKDVVQLFAGESPHGARSAETPRKKKKKDKEAKGEFLGKLSSGKKPPKEG